MTTSTTAFVLAMAVGLALTPLIRNLASKLGLLDHALSSRKIHGKPIPRVGGIAIVIAFFAPLVALLFVDSSVGEKFYADERRALALFAGGIAIALLGIYDDVRGARARTKFAVQFAVAAGMYAAGFRISVLDLPFAGPIALGWVGFPLTLLWIAGVINALNLIDGLDGLAGGVALIAVVTTGVIAFLHGQPLMVLFMATLAGALIAFLVFNFNPASIFMGDTGSMFLGLILATTAIQTNEKSSTAVALLVPIVALGFPIADTLLAIARRAVRGAPLFSADREHIHHRILALGLSHRQAVLVLYAVSVLLGVSAIVLGYATRVHAILIIAVLAILVAAVLWRLGYLQVRRGARLIQQRRRNIELHASVREIGERLGRASAYADVLEVVKSAAPALDAQVVALRLPQQAPSGRYAHGLVE